MVKSDASPDDPSLKEYWDSRNKKKSEILIPSYQKLARKQGYKCPICGESLFNDEPLQKHHKTPRSKGGNDSYANLELMHYYCHQQVHSVGQKPPTEEILEQKCQHQQIHEVDLQNESDHDVFNPW